MAVTRHRRRFVLTAAAAAAAVALSACTSVVDGAVVAGDRGPCTHVGTPMIEVPASRGAEPQMRIPQPAGWEREQELEAGDPKVRLALSEGDSAIVVMVESIPDAEAATIFENFHTGMMMGLEQQRLTADLTRTANTLCGLPSEMITVADTEPAMGGGLNTLPSDETFDTLAVVAESGGDTYLIAVLHTGIAVDDDQRREAEAILTGFEVLPQTEAEA